MCVSRNYQGALQLPSIRIPVRFLDLRHAGGRPPAGMGNPLAKSDGSEEGSFQFFPHRLKLNNEVTRNFFFLLVRVRYEVSAGGRRRVRAVQQANLEPGVRPVEAHVGYWAGLALGSVMSPLLAACEYYRTRARHGLAGHAAADQTELGPL